MNSEECALPGKILATPLITLPNIFISGNIYSVFIRYIDIITECNSILDSPLCVLKMFVVLFNSIQYLK